MSKVKDKKIIWKAVRKNQCVKYKLIPIRLSVEIHQKYHRLEEKGKKIRPRILYLAKISFISGERVFLTNKH